jgi:hypothetical protein
MNHATKVTASTLGILVGLAGIDHGIFEILQGNITPSDLMIAAIGPAQRFWQYGEETALTIIPNFLVTGILALILGILVTLWSWSFINRQYGAGILMALSIILFLVGGGFAPIFMAILASLTATQINKPLKFWRIALPEVIRSFLGKLWRGILILFVVWFVVNVEIAIFGWPLTSFFDADRAIELLDQLSYIMLGLMLLSVLTAFVHDIQMTHEEV